MANKEQTGCIVSQELVKPIAAPDPFAEFQRKVKLEVEATRHIMFEK